MRSNKNIQVFNVVGVHHVVVHSHGASWEPCTFIIYDENVQVSDAIGVYYVVVHSHGASSESCTLDFFSEMFIVCLLCV